MPTPRKAATIDELTDQLTRSKLTVIADYRGLPVSALQGFRSNLRPAGAELRVAKNTLTAIAAGKAGVEGLDPLLAGPTALVLGFDDPVQTAKVVSDFVRTSRVLTVRGAVMEGRLVSPEDVEAIATLPSREELQAKLLGMLLSPMARTVGVLSGPSRSLAYLLNARSEQLGGGALDAAAD
ncbi:MAG: 50S ribosomal protein L10 [Chloroflexota bacterium]|nr:50S ribosomal protein L10 [Chloroflexota bacterium]